MRASRGTARVRSEPPVRGARAASAQMSPVADVRRETVILVLADISGYTRFVRRHRCDQAHAERIVGELLDAVIDRAKPPLQPHQLLGDAAVFYAVSDGSTALAAGVFDQVQRICERFRERARELAGGCRCACHACRDAETLRLKVILHHGDAVITGRGGIDNLIGEDLTLAHRLLKNSIHADEYVLATSAFQRLLGDTSGQPSEQRRERCEGIGAVDVTVHYTEHDRPWPTRPPVRARAARAGRIAANGWQQLLGPNQPIARRWRRPRAVEA